MCIDTKGNQNCESYADKLFLDLWSSDIIAHLTGIFQETLHIKKEHFWRGGTEFRREHFLAAFDMMLKLLLHLSQKGVFTYHEYVWTMTTKSIEAKATWMFYIIVDNGIWFFDIANMARILVRHSCSSMLFHHLELSLRSIRYCIVILVCKLGLTLWKLTSDALKIEPTTVVKQ